MAFGAICLALFLSVAALYAQTADFDFVALDDYDIVVNPAHISGGLTLENVGTALTDVHGYWQPLAAISHMLVFSLAGDDAGAHHLASALLHALNAVLLFVALQVLTRELWPSALVAALFALHPLRVESVAWVCERRDVLSGLFWIVSVLAYGWYVRRRSVLRYCVVALAFLLALMSKPMVVTLPAVLLVLDFWPLRRWSTTARGADTSWRFLVLEKGPLLALALVVAAVTILAQSQVLALRSFDEISLGWRLLVPPLAYVTYLVQTVWPAGLSALYPHPALIGAPFAPYAAAASAAVLVLSAVTVVCVRTARTRPYLLAGWLWFLLSLLPAIGVVQVGYQWHADRFTYIPAIGLAIMAAWGVRDLVAARPAWRVPVAAMAGALLTLLAVASARQVATWRDSITLFEHAVAETKDNYVAHLVLSVELLNGNDFAGARSHLDEALRIRPTEAHTHERLGLWFEAQGDYAQAEPPFREALRLDPVASWRARDHLFETYVSADRLDEAIAVLKYAGGEPAGASEQHDVLGELLLGHQRVREAITQMEYAVALDPESTKAINNLGVALVHAGRYAEAADKFERVLALDASYEAAKGNLRYACDRLGRQMDARAPRGCSAG